jgi:hypothetical protein
MSESHSSQTVGADPSAKLATVKQGFDKAEAFMQAVSTESERMELVNIFNKFMKKASDSAESSV